MTHPDARAALEKLPDASDHFKTWRNKLISLEKAEYEAVRQALTQMIDGGWNSDMDAAPRDGTGFYVRSKTPMRWMAYKPAARQQGYPEGRWQELNEHGGWVNSEREPTEWMPYGHPITPAGEQ